MAHADLSHSSWVPALWLQHSRVQWAVCQCLWLMEQRLLRKCKYPFIALRNFVICPTAGEGKADNHLFCRQNLGSASLQLPVLLAGFLQWVPGAQTMRREGREGRQRLEREELNLQTTSQLVVAGWEQELPHVPGFYLLTNSSQRLQHSQWGRTVSRVCWGHCWLFGFFLCCNRVFPPVFQERNNLPYLSCTSSHWSETPRHRRREICTGRGCAGEKFPAAFVSRAPVLQVSLLEREKPDFYRPVQAADRERYPDVFCNYLVIIIY